MQVISFFFLLPSLCWQNHSLDEKRYSLVFFFKNEMVGEEVFFRKVLLSLFCIFIQLNLCVVSCFYFGVSEIFVGMKPFDILPV